jgi:hypothetical protein
MIMADEPRACFAGIGLLVLVSCGSAAGLSAVPGDGGAGGGSSGSQSTSGSSGSRGGGTTTTIGAGGNQGTTTTWGGDTGGYGTTTTWGGDTGGYGTTTGWGGDGGGYGTTTGGGYTGAGGAFPVCIPGQSIACACTNGDYGAQVCRADGTFGNCICASPDGGTWEQQQLARLRRGIVGTWAGMQTNPWDTSCPTKITFEANGHYSAHSPNDACVVFSYGSNDDSAEKKYLLNDVLPTAEGQGEIAFWFAPGSTNPGELKHVTLSDDENSLSFHAWKTGYGPLVFTLKRLSR